MDNTFFFFFFNMQRFSDYLLFQFLASNEVAWEKKFVATQLKSMVWQKFIRTFPYSQSSYINDDRQHLERIGTL